MTIKHLKVFICVAKYENMTSAALELYMTQPAVSLAISQLEQYYNIQLFKRVKQRIKLTEEGKLLFQYANSIINDFDEFEDIANNKSINKMINFGCSLSVGEKIIPDIFKNIDTSNLKFKVATSSDIIEGILNKDLDFGIVETPNLDEKLFVHHLINDEVVFVVSKDYDISNEIDINDLKKYPLLLRNINTGVRDTFDQLLKKYNLVINPKLEAISNYSLLEFAEKGFGIAVLPNLLCVNNKNLRKIKIKNVELYRPISLIYKNSKILPNNIKDLIADILRLFKCNY